MTKKLLSYSLIALAFAACSADDALVVDNTSDAGKQVGKISASFGGGQMVVGTFAAPITKAAASRAAVSDYGTSWELFVFPAQSGGAGGCNDSDQPYNWENHWDNILAPNKCIKYGTKTDWQTGETTDGVFSWNINGDGYDFSESNLNSPVEIAAQDFGVKPIYTSDGKATILCPLGQNSNVGKAFGIYYIDAAGDKQTLDAVSFDELGWPSGKRVGQDKQQSGAIYPDGTWENPDGGKTWGYKFQLPAGTEYGVYVVNDDDQILYSGDSGIENIFSCAGKLEVPEDLNTVRDFISFETDGRYNNVSDVTFSFVAAPEEKAQPIVDCNLTVDVPIDLDKEYIIQADDFAIHNGDILYENVADNSETSTGHNSKNSYVVVKTTDQLTVSIADVCDLYEHYKNLNDGKQYISADGILTVEVYLWPAKKVLKEGTDDLYEIVPLSRTELGVTGDAEGNYIVGEMNHPREYENDDYLVKVSAYKGFNGGGNSSEKTSYVKVSFHISPKK